MIHFKKDTKILLSIIDKVLIALAFILLILLTWDTFVSQNLKYLYNKLYILLWITFGVEYSIKVLLSKHKLRYIANDPLAILIVAFPFLRPLNLLPASRYGLLFLLEQLHEKLPWTKKFKVVEIVLLSFIALIFSADLLLIVENSPNSTIKTFSDAIWFSIATISTAGYGDFYPNTVAGRLIASFLLIFGASVYGIITAKIASLFIDNKIKEDLRIEEHKLDEISSEEKKVENLIEKIFLNEEKIEKEIAELKNQK